MNDVADDTQLLQRLIEILAGEAPRLLSEVSDAITRGDAGALDHAAHALKRSVARWATGGAFLAARELERMGRDGDTSHAADVCATADVCAILEREVDPYCGCSARGSVRR